MKVSIFSLFHNIKFKTVVKCVQSMKINPYKYSSTVFFLYKIIIENSLFHSFIHIEKNMMTFVRQQNPNNNLLFGFVRRPHGQVCKKLRDYSLPFVFIIQLPSRLVDHYLYFQLNGRGFESLPDAYARRLIIIYS